MSEHPAPEGTRYGSLTPHEKIYHDLAERLPHSGWRGKLAGLGLAADESGRARINFFGRFYLANDSGVWPESPADGALVNHRSVLAGYLMSEGFGEPAFSFVPLGRLAGPVGGPGSYEKSALEKPLRELFDRDPELLWGRIKAMGGEVRPEAAPGDFTADLMALPKIPVRLMFNQGDEELPSLVRLMYDLTAPNFLEFEFLAVLASLMVYELTTAR